MILVLVSVLVLVLVVVVVVGVHVRRERETHKHVASLLLSTPRRAHTRVSLRVSVRTRVQANTLTGDCHCRRRPCRSQMRVRRPADR